MKSKLTFIDSYGRKVEIPKNKNTFLFMMKKRNLVHVLNEVIEIVELRRTRGHRFAKVCHVALELGVDICTVKKAFRILCSRGMLQRTGKKYLILRPAEMKDFLPPKVATLLQKKA